MIIAFDHSIMTIVSAHNICKTLLHIYWYYCNFHQEGFHGILCLVVLQNLWEYLPLDSCSFLHVSRRHWHIACRFTVSVVFYHIWQKSRIYRHITEYALCLIAICRFCFLSLMHLWITFLFRNMKLPLLKLFKWHIMQVDI